MDRRTKARLTRAAAAQEAALVVLERNFARTIAQLRAWNRELIASVEAGEPTETARRFAEAYRVGFLGEGDQPRQDLANQVLREFQVRELDGMEPWALFLWANGMTSKADKRTVDGYVASIIEAMPFPCTDDDIHSIESAARPHRSRVAHA